MPPENTVAVMVAIRASGTCCAASSCGRESVMKPAYKPKDRFDMPISQMGAVKPRRFKRISWMDVRMFPEGLDEPGRWRVHGCDEAG